MKPHQIVILARPLPKRADGLPGGPFVSSRKDRDEPVSPRAEKIGQWLASRIRGRALDAIRCGPEERCRVTAALLADGLGRRHVIPSECYLGRDWGNLAGRPCADVRAALNELGSTRRRRMNPGDGESWLDLEARIRSPLGYACDKGLNFALVADQSVCRAAAGILTGSPKFATDFYLENGGFAVFECSGTSWRIVGEPENPPPNI